MALERAEDGLRRTRPLTAATLAGYVAPLGDRDDPHADPWMPSGILTEAARTLCENERAELAARAAAAAGGGAPVTPGGEPWDASGRLSPPGMLGSSSSSGGGGAGFGGMLPPAAAMTPTMQMYEQGRVPIRTQLRRAQRAARRRVGVKSRR